MPYELKAGEKIHQGQLYGWTGQDCSKCNGTGENDEARACSSCGGTGDEWGLMPNQPKDLEATDASAS